MLAFLFLIPTLPESASSTRPYTIEFQTLAKSQDQQGVDLPELLAPFESELVRCLSAPDAPTAVDLSGSVTPLGWIEGVRILEPESPSPRLDTCLRAALSE